jgi:L,D-transpeptidase ErfK/SrfK
MCIYRLFFLIALFCLTISARTWAEDSLLPTLIGSPGTTSVSNNETLMEVARREGLGFDALANANPDIDPWMPAKGADIILPRQVILPAGTGKGLTINLAELRLYHRFEQDKSTYTDIYPLGIGREGRETPEGTFRVTHKKTDPIWRVPEGLRTLHPDLPKLVPPGRDNPLGHYWIGLSAKGYGVHGTNRPLGVGRRISYGCLRMYPEHIQALYKRVKVGTPVRIVYQPIKATRTGEELLLEVHPDYLEKFADLFQEALSVISKIGGTAEIDYTQVKRVVTEQRGIPSIVGR